MLDYVVTWCDGNGAASRGTESDNFITTHIKVNNQSELWKIAYLLRLGHIIHSATINDLRKIKNYFIVEWGEEPEDIEPWFTDKYTKRDLDDINLDDIDGGDPWITKITLDGVVVYDDGYDYELEDEDDDDFFDQYDDPEEDEENIPDIPITIESLKNISDKGYL